jgi:colanic acid/amylovoran biosynthesis glycosyltransferase
VTLSGDRLPLPTVAHLVSPYLFLTGSWIHSQLQFSRETRPIVITQATEHLDIFPFSAVFNLGQGRSGPARLASSLYKIARGAYPEGPYRRILEEENVRVIHAHLGWEGARCASLARHPRRPFVVSFYGRDAGFLSRKLYWRLLYKRLFRTADRIVAEGPHMAEVLCAMGAPAERVRVVHLGIPMERFPFRERRAPASAGDPVIGLIAASFREKKGIPFALEAMARVAPRHPGLRLRIIGDGPMRREIEISIARLGLGQRVALLGYQPYPVYRRELDQAHFLMAPSITARDGDTEGGAPVCLLEAQASGLPIIATYHCDIPEVTRPGGSALLAPERDSEALASCLGLLLDHPERWGEMGGIGRSHVEAEFNIRTQVGKMSELYREILLEPLSERLGV